MTTMETLRNKYFGTITSEMFDEIEYEAKQDIGSYYYNFFNEVAVTESVNFMSSILDMIADTVSVTPHWYSVSNNVNFVYLHEVEITTRANAIFNKIATEIGDQENAASLDYKELLNLLPTILKTDSVSDCIFTRTDLVYKFVIEILNFAESMYINHHDIFIGFLLNMFAQQQ